MKKRVRPSFSDELLEYNINAGLSDLRYDQNSFSDGEVSDDISNQEFYECTFTNVTFTGRAHSCLFADVIFDHCDFSNCDFDESVFRRCEFLNCRMTGVDLGVASFQDVLLDTCQCSYANLNGTKWKTSAWKESLFRESSLNMVQFISIDLDHCDLSGSEIASSPLNGVDLSNCEINGIAVTAADLKGATVSVEQAVVCANLLGLHVKQ